MTPVLLAIASAGLLVITQPPWSVGWLAPVALVPLLISLRGASLGTRLVRGWLCGSLWSFGMVGTWLWPAARSALDTDPLTALLIALAATQLYGALHVGLFAAAAGLPGIERRPLAIAAAWVACELLRSASFAGIPWGLLGHSLWQYPSLIQLASIGGVAAVSFWLAAVNGAVAGMVIDRARRRRMLGDAATATAIIAVVTGHGLWRLAHPVAEADPLSLQVVSSEWEVLDAERADELLAAMIAATRDDRNVHSDAHIEPPEIAVWPEAALRLLPADQPELAHQIYRLGADLGLNLIFGAPRASAGRLYNSVYRLRPSNEDLLETYDKRRLVPLAEARFSPGIHTNQLRAGSNREVWILLCFEAIFPDLAAGARADFILNPTNDVGLGAGAEQQAAMAVFRAVENGISLVRVANGGPSQLVDPYGRMARRTRGWGSEVWQVPAPLADAPFSKSARWWASLLPQRMAADGPFAWACMAFTLACTADAWRRRRTQRRSRGEH